jgi:hypothetical protein
MVTTALFHVDRGREVHAAGIAGKDRAEAVAARQDALQTMSARTSGFF